MIRTHAELRFSDYLQGEGIEIVPTLRAETPVLGDVDGKFQHFAADRMVLKPLIGANADDTFAICRETGEAELVAICEIFSTQTCLVRPFMPGILTEGEFSLIYL